MIVNCMPEKNIKNLVSILKSSNGRDSFGHISSRYKSGRKIFYRNIAFKRSVFDLDGTVKSIEKDPNRNAFIALVQYKDVGYEYIIAPDGLKVGDTIHSSKDGVVDYKPGYSAPLNTIVKGTFVYNVEMSPGAGGVIARSAGNRCVLVDCDDDFATIQLPSGEVRKVPAKCYATIGSVSNALFKNEKIGKAGRNRWLGKRPHVRGVAKNPVDHPHGGGEGKTSGGRHPCTPWGKKTKGKKTRKVQVSDSMIIKRRKK